MIPIARLAAEQPLAQQCLREVSPPLIKAAIPEPV